MKKLLTLLGSFSLIAMTGTTVIACGNKNKTTPKESPIEAAKIRLKNLIDEAEAMINTSKKSQEATQKLREALLQAREIWEDPNVSLEELNEASITLQQEIDTFNKAPDPAKQKELQDKIHQARVMIVLGREEKWQESLEELEKQADLAEKSLEESQTYYDESKIIEALNKIQQAIDLYKESPNALLVTLTRTIDLAERVLGSGFGKPGSEKEKFNAVIKKAQAVRENPESRQEVKEMIVRLKDAIKYFQSLDD